VTQQKFFEKVLRALDRLEIPYMIGGSVGAMLYGEPRMTNDMDVVIELPLRKISPLADEFSTEEFYFPPTEAVENDVKRRGQFNIIHVESGSKVDMIIKKATEFAQEEFARKRPVTFSRTFEAFSASPEDIIISKLTYYDEGESEKHLEDIRGMLRVSGEAIDRTYIERWARTLGLQKHWSKLV